MNRFFDIPGDVSMQLAPWEARRRGMDWTRAWFELREPLRFRSDVAGGVIALPPGRVSDLASIPRFAHGVFMHPADPRIALGAWFHDEVYEKQGIITLECGKVVQLSRKEADHMLSFESMPDLMATEPQQHAVYQALRRFGHQWPANSRLERLE